MRRERRDEETLAWNTNTHPPTRRSGSAVCGSPLPERIRLEDTAEERPAVPHDLVSGAYNPDWWLIRMGGL